MVLFQAHITYYLTPIEILCITPKYTMPNTAILQNQTAAIAHLKIEQLLQFDFYRQTRYVYLHTLHNIDHWTRHLIINDNDVTFIAV